MKVPFFDLGRIYLLQKEEIDLAISAVLESGRYILGQVCKAFEENLKKTLANDGLGEVVACNSGTDALVISLLAAGVMPGDHVITVSHTAIPTISAIREMGANPNFIDINPTTWLMDLKGIESAVTPKTKALIAVHLYGNMVPVPEINAILKKMSREDISIIEDVAQAQGALLHSRPAGTLGRFGAFSFYPTKNLGALGDGGAVYCKSVKDADLLRMLRNYGKKDHQMAQIPRGINSRLDEIQAAILNVRLDWVAKMNEKKAEMTERYRTAFRGLPIKFQEVTQKCQPGWHLCVIALESEGIRNQLEMFLAERGVQTLIHYPIPTHLQAAFNSKNYLPLPQTENLAKRILTLPMNTALREEEQAYVIQTTCSFFQ